jgi:periplasmic divalent cation tolerance protein
VPEFIQVVTTTPKKEDAQRISDYVVRGRLAACVQVIGPVASTYWWRDNVESAEEWLCLIKSRRDVYQQLEAAIREIHPYEVPEILAVPVVEGSRSYLDWLDTEVRPVTSRP